MDWPLANNSDLSDKRIQMLEYKLLWDRDLTLKCAFFRGEGEAFRKVGSLNTQEKEAGVTGKESCWDTNMQDT